MSEGGRTGAIAAGLAFAFFCVFLLGIWSGNTDNQYAAPYSETNQQAYPYPEEEAARLGIPPGSRKTYEQICGYPSDREDADLCQQWRSANSSRESAKWAFWGFWLSAFGAIGVAVTVFYAVRTFRLQVGTTRAELRAYISTRCGGVLEFSETRFATTVLFDNDGQTPAYDVRSVILPFVVNNPIHPMDTGFVLETIANTPMEERTNYVARGRGHSLQNDSPPNEAFLREREAVMAGTRQIAVCGKIEYRDTFGATHTTKFFHLYPNGRWQPDQGYYHSQGNDAD